MQAKKAKQKAVRRSGLLQCVEFLDTLQKGEQSRTAIACRS